MSNQWIPGRMPDLPGANLPPKPASPAAAGTGPPIEVAQLVDLTGGDPATVRRYLDLFSQLTAPAIAALADAHQAGDRDQVRRHAHKIKGSCAMVGAKATAAVAATIEHHVAADGLTGIEPLLAQLRDQFEIARTFAAAYRGDTP